MLRQDECKKYSRKGCEGTRVRKTGGALLYFSYTPTRLYCVVLCCIATCLCTFFPYPPYEQAHLDSATGSSCNRSTHTHCDEVGVKGKKMPKVAAEDTRNGNWECLRSAYVAITFLTLTFGSAVFSRVLFFTAKRECQPSSDLGRKEKLQRSQHGPAREECCCRVEVVCDIGNSCTAPPRSPRQISNASKRR